MYVCRFIVMEFLSYIAFCSFCAGQPTVSPVGRTVSLVEGQDRSVVYNVSVGNPPSILGVVPPGAEPSTRVLFNDTRVFINNVNRGDNGSYTATWTNGVGEAVFSLDLVVTGEVFVYC